MLTEEQFKELADRLVDTRQNIYRLSEQMFGHDLTDADWAAVERVGGIFRCIECNTWLGNNARSAGSIEVCCMCDDERNAED